MDETTNPPWSQNRNATADDTIAVLAKQIEYLREDIAELRTTISSQNDSKVSIREWTLRNEHVNNRFESLGREIGDLRTEVRAKNAPWWSIAAIIISGIVAAWTILGPT